LKGLIGAEWSFAQKIARLFFTVENEKETRKNLVHV